MCYNSLSITGRGKRTTVTELLITMYNRTARQKENKLKIRWKRYTDNDYDNNNDCDNNNNKTNNDNNNKSNNGK